MNLLDLLVLGLDQLVELALFSLEELCAFLFLLGFANKTLRGEFHLGADAGDLFLEFQTGSCELHLHVLNLGLLFGYLHLEVLPELVVLLQEGVQLLSVGQVRLSLCVDFKVQHGHFVFVETLQRLHVGLVQLRHLHLQ
jgi:hypothetical protein